MPYAQTHYAQRLGTGPFTIAQAGCFLTAFSNLLERFGEAVAPPDLNSFFIQHGKYVDVDGDATMDDLAWGTVSAYDGQIATVQLGGAGWPDSNDAIVKFAYISPNTHRPTTHFCLVVDHTTGMILDSWDGVVKKSPYGTPVGWAKYERHAPQQVVLPPAPSEAAAFTITERYEGGRNEVVKQAGGANLWDLNRRSWPDLVNNPAGHTDENSPITVHAKAHHILGGDYYLIDAAGSQGYNVVDCQDAPAPVVAAPSAPPAGPYTVSSGQTYTVKYKIKGYGTATMAGNHDKPIGDVEPGDYAVYNIYPNRSDLINVTKTPGKPGAWINTADDVEPAPEPPAPVVAPVVAPEATPGPAPTSTPTSPVTVPDTTPETPKAPDWRASYRAFIDRNGLKNVVMYVALQNYTVKPVDGKGPEVSLHPGDYIKIGGTFTGPDGKVYYRPEDAAEKFLWHGVPDVEAPDEIIEPYAKVYDTSTTPAQRRALGTSKAGDKLVYIADDVKQLVEKLEKAWDVLPFKKKKVIKK